MRSKRSNTFKFHSFITVDFRFSTAPTPTRRNLKIAQFVIPFAPVPGEIHHVLRCASAKATCSDSGYKTSLSMPSTSHLAQNLSRAEPISQSRPVMRVHLFRRFQNRCALIFQIGLFATLHHYYISRRRRRLVAANHG
jgi:hypothetical protein